MVWGCGVLILKILKKNMTVSLLVLQKNAPTYKTTLIKRFFICQIQTLLLKILFHSMII